MPGSSAGPVTGSPKTACWRSFSNRSFIDTRTFDGFRDVVSREFNEVRVVDLGGDVRSNPKLSGTRHNVFGIQTGVAISFWVKRHKAQGCRIFYVRRPEFETREDKIAFLGSAELSELEFEEVQPDARHNWINLTQNDFNSLLPIATKHVKATRKHFQEKALFKLFSLGISTNRDEWIYDEDQDCLARKMKFFVEQYESQNQSADFKTAIRWSRNLKRRFGQGKREKFDPRHIVEAQYRPYCKKALYDSTLLMTELAKPVSRPRPG